MKSKGSRGGKTTTGKARAATAGDVKKFKVDNAKLSKIAGGKASSGGKGSHDRITVN